MLKNHTKKVAAKNLSISFSKASAALLLGIFILSSFIFLTSAKQIGFAESQPNAAVSKTIAGLNQSVTVTAEEAGTSRIKFSDGRDIEINRSSAASSAQETPLALATGDFNSDGYEDIIGGYATADGGGNITLYQTNIDSIAPRTEKIHTEMMNGHFPAPILPETTSVAIPEKPDFVGVGDFNRDGYKDILTAARGSFNLHLLTGNGHGRFKYQGHFEMSGSITAMLADDIDNYDGMTDVIVGIGGNAPKAFIFHNTAEMFAQAPDVVDLPAEATAFAVGQLDTDVYKDLVIAAGNEILVAHGYNQLEEKKSAASIDRIALTSAPVSVATGEFLFDREARTEIAVLTDDGAVNFVARGDIDRRPYSAEEMKAILEKRRNRDYDGLAAFKKSRVRRSGSSAWTIAETPVKATGGKVGAQAKLVAAPLAGLSTEDLIVVNSANSQMQLVQSSQSEIDSQPSVVDLNVENGAVAAVPLRLNLDSAPDIALLRQGSDAPTVIMSPANTISVTAGATDVIANNGVCSLREAIINANSDNQSGSTDCTGGLGADTIMVPAMTYTLAIGAFDEDQLLDGYHPESGDLDIADEDGTGAAIGDLTISGVAGSTIIQAGTTPSNGIDRVFDVNNFVSSGTAVNATFTNLIIRHGIGKIGSFGYFTPGGGIQFDGFDVPTNGSSSKALNLNNTTVTLNTAAGQGGGILALNGAANFISSTIASNTIADTGNITTWNNAAGGGMSYDGGGAPTPTRTFQMSGTIFTGNLISDSDAGQQNFGQGGGARIAGGTGATISGTITNNDAASFGGGFSIDTIPAVTVSNTTITGNDAKTNGGGIFSKPIFSNGTLSTLTMTGNTIASNRADVDNNATGATVDGDGGGIFQERGNLTLSGGSIGGSGTANTAFNGGGIAHRYEGAPSSSIINNSTITLDNTTISFNTARNEGGGIYNNSFNQTANSILNLGSTTNINLLTNTANANGGGVANLNSATGNLTRVIIRGNKADNDNNSSGNGGGVFNNNGTITAVANCFIGGTSAGEPNSAVNGGGISNTTGPLTVTGASITGNIANSNGGGINNTTGALTVTGASINNNSAKNNGGGINFDSGAPTSAVSSSTNINSNVADSDNSGAGGGGGVYIGASVLDITSSTIQSNTKQGILVAGGTGNTFNANVITNNTALGIDLGGSGVTLNDATDSDSGPNNLQNFPVLNYVKSTGEANVTLTSNPSRNFRIDYFANATCDASGYGEGEVFLTNQNVTTNGSGTITFNSAALSFGSRRQITATATDLVTGDTSEFSACKEVNTLPTISAASGVTRQQGSAASNSQIATVNDIDQTENTLIMTVNGGASATVNGVTVSGISVDASGNVTANIVAACSATNASFTVRVTDNATEFNEATLNVAVTANTAPSVGNYANTVVNIGSNITVTPDASPTDNGSIASVTAAAAPAGFTGTFSGNTSTGAVTITNAAPAGIYTITVTTTDNCGLSTTKQFTLTVNTPPTISAASGVTRQQGSAATNSQIATVNDADQTENTLTVTVNGSASATVNGVTVSNIAVSAAGAVTANIAADCSATSASFTLRVTDDQSAFAEATLNVAVSANTAPTAGTYSNVTVLPGGGTTVTPNAAPTDNGSIASVTATASPAGFTGTFSGNTSTGAVTITNAAPAGVYSVTVTTTDNCGATTTRQFTLTVNTPPTISAASGVTRQQGSAVSNSQVATVNDADQTENTLVVTVNGGTSATVNGVTLSNIAVNASGQVTADVIAACGATDANFTLRVIDNQSAFAEATLTVTVTANTAPTVGNYANTVVNVGSNITVTPNASPTDNGSIASVTAAAAPAGFTGTFSGNTSTGAVTITNAAPAGTYTITVTTTDNCGLTTTKQFTLTVNAPPTISAASGVTRQQGSAVSSSQIATVNDIDQTENTLVMTVNGGASATVNGVTVSGISVDASGNVTANIIAACGATNANFTLRVTDNQSVFAEATLTVTVTADTAPTVGTYSNVTVLSGGGTTVTPNAAPTDNGSIATVTAAASPAGFTGTFSGNTTTGAITITNAAPVGAFTVTVTTTDNCGITSTNQFTLTVTNTITWAGGTNTDWNTASNWSPAFVPAAASDVSIPSSGVTNEPSISTADVTINSLNIASGRTLTIASGRTLTVTNTLTNNGTINVAGSFTAGTLVDNGIINFNGTGVQTIPAGIYNNLTINNAAGFTLGGNVTVNGVLTLTNGVVNTGSFTLTIGSGGSISGASASSYIIGGVKKIFSASFPATESASSIASLFASPTALPSAFLYPVGTANGFSPVTINATAGGGNLAFTVSATEDFLPGVNLSQTIKRYWTLTPDGITQADITFQYLDQDVSTGADESGFNFIRRSGSTNTYFAPTSLNAATNTFTLNNVTQFSPWSLGSPLAPTAATTTVGGRVIETNGRGVRNATVTMTDEQGQIRTAVTTTFGYYRFTNVEVGHTYVLGVRAKRYNFSQPSQVLNVDSETGSINFIANSAR